MASVPAREPGVPAAGADRGQAPRRLSRLARLRPPEPGRGWLRWGAGALLLVAAGLSLAGLTGIGLHALPGVLRTAAVGVAFWGLCGWGLANALVPARLAAHRLLAVLPIGAVSSSFALAVLGLLHVPFAISLGVVVAGAVALALRFRHPRAAPERRRSTAAAGVGAPVLVATVIALVALIPVFRAGFETIPGQNGDAILVSGSAVLVEHAPPTATRNDLPINRIPLEWRSKYSIYYALAAVSTLAGQTPIQAFAVVSALVLAATALGLFLFALYALRAPPWVALLATFVVPLDRIVMYVTVHPYYNELWGQFALPLMLLFGWLYLREPSRGAAALFVLFLIFGLLVYPLMVLFPVLFLVPYGWGRWRSARRRGERVGWIAQLRLPRVLARPWVWVPLAVVAVPVCIVLVRGFDEKVLSAVDVLLPGTSLAGWSGPGLPFLPGPRFFGMPGGGALDYLGLAAICVMAALGLRRVRPELRVPMGVMVIVTGLVGVYFRLRTGGQLFFFKDLAFLGPYVLMLALLGLAGVAVSRRRAVAVAGAAGLIAASAVVAFGGEEEIHQTYPQATRSVLALASWDRAIPRPASVRIDVPPSGWQLWADYMLHDHPLTALAPLGGFFPHAPPGRKADYVLTYRPGPRPADAVGGPLLRSAQFELWRMNPATPGPDVSRRGLIWDVTKITF